MKVDELLNAALGFMFRVEHIRDGEVIGFEDFSPNQMVNEGLDDIWNAYFKGSPAVPGDGELYMGLYTNSGSLDQETELTDITEPSGYGYARISVARSAVTITEEDTPAQAYFTTDQKTFTASGGAWSTVYGGFLCIDRAAGSDVLICFDEFSTTRTLQDGDQLKVTVKGKRQNPA